MGTTTQNPTSSAPAQVTAPAASSPQGFTAQQIQNLYTDQLKTYDVPRALKGVTGQGPGGTYTLSQLQSLNPSWMSQRSRADWNSALSGLGSINPQTPAGVSNPQNPAPYSMTMPWANLAQTDPGFQAMAKNAGYGDTVTPMPAMTPMGWSSAGIGGVQPTASPTPVTGGLMNQGPSIPWQLLAGKGR